MTVLALLALLCGMSASVQAQTASYSGSTSAFDTTDFAGPQGIATDASGNVFIADNGAPPAVYEMTRTGPGAYSTPVALPAPASAYTSLKGIAIDSNGNLWVADYGTTKGQVYELAYDSGSKTFATPVAVGTAWTNPWAIGADALGNVFVTDGGVNAGANNIFEISVPGGTPTVTPVNNTTVAYPRGIAVDAAENIFVIDGNSSQVKELTSSSSYASASTVNTYGFQGPGDIALDAKGNIFVTAFSVNLVRELTAADNYATILTWGSGLNGPLAVWPDADGNLLVSNGNDHAIRQIATRAVNFGTVAVGSTSGTQTVQFTFTGAANTAIQAPLVVTAGASGQDFVDAGTGSCTTTNGAGNAYAPQSSCTVNVSLKPKYAGSRPGAVKLLDTSGNLLATAYVYGSGSGPELVFPSSQTLQTVGGGFSSPTTAAIDGSGNLYVADQGNNAVKKVPTGCTDSSCVTLLGGGFNFAYGVAVDGAGNLYVADGGNSAVKEMSPSCADSTCVTTLGGGFGNPEGVAVDGAGNIYVADYNNNAIYEMPQGCADSSCVTTLGAGFTNPKGVAVDASGNIYVADLGNNAVKEMTPGCTSAACVTILGGGFSSARGVAVDGGGDVYVADSGNNAVKEMPAGCVDASCVTTLGSGFYVPYDMTMDSTGNVYVVDTGNNAVKQLSLTTPPSLSFLDTKAGTQSTDSPQTVTLRNIGNAPLTFPVPDTGNNPSVAANFALDVSTTCPQVTSSSSAGTLAGGTTCQLAVDFVPATIGSLSGQAVLMDDNLNASPAVTQSIGLSGSANSPIAPYIRLNGGGWQQLPNITVNTGDTVDLAGKPLSGTWSWTGPNGFTSTSREIDNVALPSGSNVYTATYTDASSNTSTLSITVTINPTSIVPYLQVNGGAWQQGVSSVTVNVGDTVNLGGQQLSTGTWGWTGPNGYTASTRVINAIPLTSPTNLYTLTYTNVAGVTTTRAFTITVNPTPVLPYIQVNSGGWLQTGSLAVNAGDTVNLAGQLFSTGTYSWTGPNGFSASNTRLLNAIPLTSASSSYTLTYTNAAGVNSTQVFTITVKATTIVPYIQVNTGGWQQLATVTVNAGDTVNLNPSPTSGGSWSWTGPGGFTSTARMLNGVPLTSASNVYTATYTNTVGVTSTQAFTLNVSSNPTPIVPYIQVNGGSWRQMSSVTINAGDTVSLGGYPISGGSWSWSGPSGFTATGRLISASALTSASNVYTATYTNVVGAKSTQSFTIHVNSTPIVPYIQVNGGGWQQGVSSATVNAGDTVNLGGQPLSTGTWHWSGPSGYTASTRVINAVPLASATNSYTLTYTNVDGVASTQVFTIHVNSTPIVPYLQVNGGKWQQGVSSVTVNAGDTVNLAGQNISGGTWHWTGPNGYSTSTREIDAIPLTSSTNTFTLTYTNTAGIVSTQAFTVHVNSTPIVPYVQVNGGPWQQGVSTVTVNAGATVNLAGQLLSTGSWRWTGPNGYTANTRVISPTSLASGANSYTLTYTNADGVASTQAFTITVN